MNIMQDHVSRKAKRVSGVLKDKFGYGVEDFKEFLNGDVEKLKALAQANNDVTTARELIPIVKDALINVQQGTEEYNRAIADIIKQGGKSATAIDKAKMSASLDNTRFVNARNELSHEYVVSRAVEKQRHKHAIDYIKLKAIIDNKMTAVDNRAVMEAQVYRPELRQMSEDASYESRVRSHVLDFGADERRELLPRKDYEKATSGIVSKVKTFLGISV